MGDQEVYGSQLGGGDGQGSSATSDENVSEPQGSQPSPQEPTADEQPITRKDLEALKQEVLRSTQSMTDGAVSRMDKKFQDAIARAKETIELGKQAGVQYTPQQEKAIRDRFIDQVYEQTVNDGAETPPQDSQRMPAQQDQGYNPVAALVTAEVQRIMAETGVYISGEEADKAIIGDGSRQISPFQYIEAFKNLAKQKQQGQSGAPNPSIPSFVPGGKPTTSQAALRQRYDQELAQIRDGTHSTITRGDHYAIQKMESEYRRQGLEL